MHLLPRFVIHRFVIQLQSHLPRCAAVKLGALAASLCHSWAFHLAAIKHASLCSCHARCTCCLALSFFSLSRQRSVLPATGVGWLYPLVWWSAVRLPPRDCPCPAPGLSAEVASAPLRGGGSAGLLDLACLCPFLTWLVLSLLGSSLSFFLAFFPCILAFRA